MISKRLNTKLMYGGSPYSYLGFPLQAKKAGAESESRATVQPMTTEGAETAPSKKESAMEPIIVAPTKKRKELTPEQRAKKNEGDRLRRARQKQARTGINPDVATQAPPTNF